MSRDFGPRVIIDTLQGAGSTAWHSASPSALPDFESSRERNVRQSKKPRGVVLIKLQDEDEVRIDASDGYDRYAVQLPLRARFPDEGRLTPSADGHYAYLESPMEGRHTPTLPDFTQRGEGLGD